MEQRWRVVGWQGGWSYTGEELASEGLSLKKLFLVASGKPKNKIGELANRNVADSQSCL